MATRAQLERSVDALTLGAASEDVRKVPPTPAFRRIVVGVDGDPGSRAALAWAAALAKAWKGRVWAVCAGPRSGQPGTPELTRGRRMRAAFEEEAEHVDDVLADAHSRLEAAGVRHDLVAAAGTPASVLVRQATRLKADLLVLGSHGHTALERFNLGSVAESAKHTAPCSVLIARTSPPPRSILAATDGSAPSRSGVHLAAGLAQRLGAIAYVYHALPFAYRENTKGPASPPGVTFLKGTGPAAAGMMQEAKRRRSGLIIIGSRGLGGLSSVALGSVSDRVTRKAACSVLVVKPKARS